MNKYILHKAFFSTEELDKVKMVFSEPVIQKTDFYTVQTAEKISDKQLAELAEDLSCDINKLPENFSGQEVRLLVTDMDSTLIAIECIDEIADMLGLKPQVSTITESAMRGEIGFEASLTQRVALLKGLPVADLQRVYDERLKLNPGAEVLIDFLKKSSVTIALVSGGFTFFTDKLKERLGLDHTLANILGVENGLLTGKVDGDIVGAQSKATLLLALVEEMGISQQQVIAMGDGANDLVMMEHAGLSVAYHAKPAVQAKTHVQINTKGLDTVIDFLRA